MEHAALQLTRGGFPGASRIDVAHEYGVAEEHYAHNYDEKADYRFFYEAKPTVNAF
jgi:hypothetical protein